MQWLFDAYIAIRDFMELGGPVLYVIAMVILWMWVLILERIIYFRTEHHQHVVAESAVWMSRQERTSWHAEQVRAGMVSRISVAAHGSIPMIKTMVARLAAKLKDNPDDLQGWKRLAQAYRVIGDAPGLTDAEAQIERLEARIQKQEQTNSP